MYRNPFDTPMSQYAFVLNYPLCYSSTGYQILLLEKNFYRVIDLKPSFETYVWCSADGGSPRPILYDIKSNIFQDMQVGNDIWPPILWQPRALGGDMIWQNNIYDNMTADLGNSAKGYPLTYFTMKNETIRNS